MKIPELILPSIESYIIKAYAQGYLDAQRVSDPPVYASGTSIRKLATENLEYIKKNSRAVEF